MRICTVIERILLHLNNYKVKDKSFEVPYAVTQSGIADNLGISRAHVSREIRRLREEKKDIIKEDLRHVKGLNKKRKVYFLSSEGVKKVNEIKKGIKNEKIKIRLDEGIKEIELDDVDKYVDDPFPILKALKHIDDQKRLDLTEIKEKKDIFVGREDQIEKLKSMIDSVKKEGCKSIFISGEAGIGKTTLVNKLESYASKKGFEFLVGNSHFDSSDPYLPFKEAFERYSEEVDEEPLFGSIFLTSRSYNQESTSEKAFNAKRQSVFYESTKWVEDIASDNPLIVFLDDLQWADKATLRLLHYMIKRLGNSPEDSPILFIGSYRPEEVDQGHPLKDVIQRLSRTHLLKVLKLEPLSVIETKKIVQKMIGRKNIPDDFLMLLFEVTKGNPLFIKECVDDMSDSGIIKPESQEYPESKDDMNIPDMVRDVIERKIEKLDNLTVKILQLSSVMGEEVPFQLLNKVSSETMDIDEFELFEHIDTLVRTGIWFEKPNEEVFFYSHGLIQLTVYESILHNVRNRYHLKVAEVIEDEYKDCIEEYYFDLAFHYEKASRFQEAAKYYIKAGEKAEQIYAHEDALEMYKKVLRIIDQIPDSDIENFVILNKIATVYHLIGENIECREYLNRAFDEAKTIKEKSKVRYMLSKSFMKQSEYDKAMQEVEKGLKLLEGESVEKIKLLDRKGWIFFRTGKYDKAEEIFRELETLSKRLDDKEGIAQTLHSIGSVLVQKSRYKEAFDYLTKCISIRKKLGDKKGLSSTYNNIGLTKLHLGELDEALEYYIKSKEIGEEIGDVYMIINPLNNIGSIYVKKGEMDKALSSYQKGLEKCEMIENENTKSIILGNIGNYYLEKGDLDKALDHINKSMDISREINNLYMILENYWNFSKLYLIKEELDEAERYIRKLKARAKEIDDTHKLAVGHRLEGTLHSKREDFEKSEEKFEKALETFQDLGDTEQIGKVFYEMGIMWKKRGELDKAKNSLRKAQSHFEEIGTDLLKKKAVDALKEVKKE